MKNKGFTLTEIIAVIVVLSILIVIAIPVYNGVTKNVKEKTLETKKNALQIAAIKYASENNVNSTIKITGTKLILDNYYKAESYIDNDKELPFIANPMDINDNLACHPITITLDNYEYNAVVEDSSDCSISKNEIDDNKIKVLAYEIGTNNLIGFENFNETKWTNKDVLLKVETDLDYELIDFTMFGDTTSTSNNTYEVRANLFLNQEVDITLRLKDKSIKSKKVIVKIDKEKPVVRDDIGYNNEPGKTSSAVLASDGLGSGILKVLYARADTYNGNKIEAELEYQTNKSVKAILDQNLRNGKEYYVWAHDKAGNESEKYTYTVNGILEKYKITYNGNGGTASKNEDIINQGSTITNIATASRSGYNFAGWWTQSSGGTEIKNGSTINDDITLFAHWNPIQYTLTINTNGGSYNGSTTITQNVNTTYSPSIPTKSGHNFSYWQSSGGSWNGSTFTFTGNGTLTAVWTPVKSVTVYSNVPNGGGSATYSTTINYGSSASISATPYSGYYLSGVSCDPGISISGFGTGNSYTNTQYGTVYNNYDGTGSKYCYFTFTRNGSLAIVVENGTASESSLNFNSTNSNYVTINPNNSKYALASVSCTSGYKASGFKVGYKYNKQQKIKIAKSTSGNISGTCTIKYDRVCYIWKQGSSGTTYGNTKDSHYNYEGQYRCFNGKGAIVNCRYNGKECFMNNVYFNWTGGNVCNYKNQCHYQEPLSGYTCGKSCVTTMCLNKGDGHFFGTCRTDMGWGLYAGAPGGNMSSNINCTCPDNENDQAFNELTESGEQLDSLVELTEEDALLIEDRYNDILLDDNWDLLDSLTDELIEEPLIDSGDELIEEPLIDSGDELLWP